jgi:hypothetical protein
MKTNDPPRPHPDEREAVTLWLAAKVLRLAAEFDTGPAGLERLIAFAQKVQKQNLPNA